MKHFEVDVDITMSKRISVEAESEERAKAIVNGWMKYNPYEYAHSFDAYVKHEITDVNEEEPEEERTTLDEGLDYVREQLDSDDLAIIRAKVSKNMKERCSAWYGVDYAKVEELLYEYGEDHDLIDENADEEGWENYGDIDDILIKL